MHFRICSLIGISLDYLVVVGFSERSQLIEIFAMAIMIMCYSGCSRHAKEFVGRDLKMVKGFIVNT